MIEYEYETRTISVIVVPKKQTIFSHLATHVRIADEASGEYVEVNQSSRAMGKIAIEPEEWPTLRAAIDRMIGECRKGDDDDK